MANPYRAMCAELLAWAEHTSSHYYKQPDVLNRARSLLAQPEPESPSPISAHDLAIQWNRQADPAEQWDTLELYEQLAWAQSRAIAAELEGQP